MTGIAGSLAHTSLKEAERAQVGDQQTLDDFTDREDPTYVAVTDTAPDSAAIDETCADLAPPHDLLGEFLQERTEIMDAQGCSKAYAHTLAFERTDYASRYRTAIWEASGRPDSDALVEMGTRVAEGDHVVLVCYCAGASACHRRVLYEELTEWLSLYDSVEGTPDPGTTTEQIQQTLTEVLE